MPDREDDDTTKVPSSRVQGMNAQAPRPMSADELASWASWALTQADRIDPVVSGVYKTRPAEPSE